MKAYRIGEILLCSFPFSNGQIKKRPALVVLDYGDNDVLVTRITSHIPQTRFDYSIMEWQKSGLLLPSIIRASKIAFLDKTYIERSLGRLEQSDIDTFGPILLSIFDTFK